MLLAQIQLHMLSQQTAATLELLSACTSLFKEQAQQAQHAQQAQQGQPQSQLLWSQLQLHFCILRVLVMLTEGRYVELIASGTSRTIALCPAMCRILCNQSYEEVASHFLISEWCQSLGRHNSLWLSKGVLRRDKQHSHQHCCSYKTPTFPMWR